MGLYESFLKSDYADFDKWKAARERRRENFKKKQQDIVEQNKTPCFFCGCEKDIEFHHKNPLEKEFNVGSRPGDRGKQKLLNEIKKCWCLCRECHQKLHQRLLDPLPEYY